MSLKSIESWIYRVDSLSSYSIPGKVVGSYQEDIADILNEIKSRDSLLYPESYEDRPWYFPKRTFFDSPDSFLDTWIEWYKQGESKFWTNRVYEKLGFELKYVNSEPESDFFNIATEIPVFPHEWIQNERLNPIMLCADGNQLYDQNWYMNIWVNDFRTTKALVYRWKEIKWTALPIGEDISYDIVSGPELEKHLRNDINYYMWKWKEKFPFTSSNWLKAIGKIWHMIGISPIEVYEKLEKLNFKFPE